MVSNNFKSKAINIAFKSFIKEIEIKGWYVWFTKGCAYLNRHKNKKINALMCTIRGAMLNKDLEAFVTQDSKNAFSNVCKLFLPLIDKNFNNSNRGLKDEEYEYLVHCVNTFIQTFIEHGILTFARDLAKEIRLEQLGETIFVRAAKKIFGKEFKLCKPENNNINAMLPLTKTEEEIVKQILHNYSGQGLTTQQMYGKIIEALRNHRSELEIVSDLVVSDRGATVTWGEVMDVPVDGHFYEDEVDYWEDDD